MLARGCGRRVRRASSVLAGAFVWAAAANAEQLRVTITLLPVPGAPASAPRFTIELADSTRTKRLPAFTLVDTPNGPQVSRYALELPPVTVGGARLAARYGDHAWAANLPVAAISGFNLDPRPLRGLSMGVSHGQTSLSVGVGQMGGRADSLFGSAVPRVMALGGVVKPHARLAIAPRLAVPLGDTKAPGAVAPTLGAGGRVDVSPHLALVADAGFSRAAGEWVRAAAAGILARQERASVEASLSRIGASYSLAGPVPYAGQDREMVAASGTVRRGLSVSGHLTRVRPHGRPQRTSGTTSAGISVRTEHALGGTLSMTHERTEDRSRRTASVRTEWQRAAGRWASTLGVTARREAARAKAGTGATTGELSARLQSRRPLWQRLTLDSRTSWTLSRPQPGAGRVRWWLASRLGLSERLAVDGELDGEVLGGVRGRFLPRRARVAAELVMVEATRIRIVYGHGPGWTPSGRPRVGLQLIRTIDF